MIARMPLTRAQLTAAMLLLAACSADSPTTPSNGVATVTLDQTSANLVLGSTLQLIATPRDGSGNPLTGRAIVWSTNSPAVAAVSSSGLVTAVSAGTAQITATSEGHSASATLNVTASGIGASGGVVSAANGNASVSIPAGALTNNTPITVTPITRAGDARLVPGTAHDFGPSGTTFATPVTLSIRYDASSEAGRNPSQFRIHKLIGTTWTAIAGSTVNTATRTVTAQTSSFSTYAILEMATPIATITVTAPSTTVVVGTTAQLTAVAKDAAGNVLTRSVTWQAIPATAATVSSSGVVTPLVAGAATIRATSENVSGDIALTIVPAGFALQQISTSDHVCAVSASGTGYCWGSNEAGVLGDGTRTYRNRPTAVLGGLAWKQIEVGVDDDSFFTCGLTTAGALWCWGSNFDGALGDGSNVHSLTPTRAFTNLSFTQLVTGDDWGCALTATGEAWCWGENERGQLGIGDEINRRTPGRVTGGHLFTMLAAGEYFACGLKQSGETWCWGLNSRGQLGDGTNTGHSSPMRVTTPVSFTRIAAGSAAACGLTSGGEAWCWGNTPAGSTATPVRAFSGLTLSQIAVGDDYYCGLTAAGEAWCAGSNSTGELGDGSTTSRTAPVAVSGGLRFKQIAPNKNNRTTCGITLTGDAWCWGQNFSGAVGDGTNINRLIPVKVLAP